jgi:hypothetical protein
MIVPLRSVIGSRPRRNCGMGLHLGSAISCVAVCHLQGDIQVIEERGGVQDYFGRRPAAVPKRHAGGFGKIGSTGVADHLTLNVISELAGDEYLCVDTDRSRRKVAPRNSWRNGRIRILNLT